MTLARSPSRLCRRTVVFALFVFFLFYELSRSLSNGDSHGVVSAANATLGFGHIYVVSKPGSPRRPSITQAANVTGLQFTIPVQPVWTEDDKDSFRAPQNSSISGGSLMAWLGHLHALREYATGYFFPTS
jgi:hypothetical protein